MNERMNKERAIEIIKDLKQEAKVNEPELKYTDKEYTQALDIAIESLEQNIQTIIVEREFTLEEMNKGLEYCTYKAHRELIKRLLELKLIDIKSMNDIFGKGTVEFRLKVVEPYERKE